MTGSYEVVLYNGNKKRISNNSRVIDPEKFKKIMAEKNLMFSEAARQIGYASNSISSALQTGYFNNIMIKGIETYYGIKYEDYAFIPEKPKEEQAEGQNMAELYNVIKAAVVDGMNEAIAGNMKNLRGGIYTAIYQAVNAVKKERQ